MTDIADIMAKMPKSIQDRVRTAEDVRPELRPTPSTALNAALGGGFGMGRFVLVWGDKSAGKSSLCLQIVAKAQAEGKTCAWFDAEGVFDSDWAERLGVDTKNLILSTARGMSAFGDTAVALSKAGVDIVVVDSINFLIPDSYLEKDGSSLAGMDKTKKIGTFSQGLKAAVSSMAYENEHTMFLFISQATTQITPQFSMQTFAGGNFFKYALAQSVRLTSSNGKTSFVRNDQGFPIGRKVDFLVEFNKIGPQGRTGEYTFYFDGHTVGVDTMGELFDLGKLHGILEGGGSWGEYEGVKLNGQKAWSEYLNENPEVAAKLAEEVYNAESARTNS